MLIKCYIQGIRNGFIWLSLIISPMIMSMLTNGVLTTNELSELLLVLVPSITVGLLAEKQRRYIKQLKETYIATLKALAETTDARDSYTQGHSERVARYAVLIAVPDAVLHKRNSLNEEEWVIMRKHPEYSQRIVSNLNFLSETIPTILYHHKRFDHKGYLLGNWKVKYLWPLGY
jgi:HD-GYP domain-containing protein (c-di-GMP phosphodiesterase class II)